MWLGVSARAVYRVVVVVTAMGNRWIRCVIRACLRGLKQTYRGNPHMYLATRSLYWRRSEHSKCKSNPRQTHLFPCQLMTRKHHVSPIPVYQIVIWVIITPTDNSYSLIFTVTDTVCLCMFMFFEWGCRRRSESVILSSALGGSGEEQTGDI